MKNTNSWMFWFSLVVYLIYFTAFIDAPKNIAGAGFIVCIILSLASLIMSIIGIRNNLKAKIPVAQSSIVILIINSVIFTLLLTVMLMFTFLPYNLSIG